MKKIIYLCFLILPITLFSQTKNNYPKEVEEVLQKAKANRNELEKVILNYNKSKADSLKLKAAYFLIINMDIHYSADYYWADSTGKRIDYNEMDYPNFFAAVDAFEAIKPKYGKVKPVPFKYLDIDTIKATYLINNIDNAFISWQLPQAKNLSFEEFCNNILPYRVSNEPLQQWRDVYKNKFSWIKDSAANKSTEETLKYFASDFRSWFINTWDLEQRKEPLPRLGPIQLLNRKKGNCDDIGDLMVYTLRSQGYPASLEHIPLWATTSGRHFFNSTYDINGKLIPFDVSTNNVKIDNFSREPSKVVRITYAKQANVLSNILPQNQIPEGFMRMKNYLDVTSEYWQTASLETPLFESFNKPKIAFACVFNGFKWQPTWWGRVFNNKAVFEKLCKGAVFLPSYYINNKVIPAGYPIASGYQKQQILKPDKINTRTITIKQQDKYLLFRIDKKYKLFYWDNNWKLIGEEIATENTTELLFKNVPNNALMLLVPEYSQGKERPFTITADGERQWW
ncbi:transglutaminase domain-containing protein [Pedobacter aquae]|uniref:Transglutaminase domain-containing protein n=1 Tax=Pedobacter aquae TaxID=2605747 RepID=A0A5C0VKR8_9SPHI|nr:transglutaminase-like domain-containing protein [Pedobacter aquae]QEK52462.1 transglutaminase domain-containing protein [Pedobacter aquae]